MYPTFPVNGSPLSETGLFDLLKNRLDNDFYVFHSVDYILSVPRKRVKEGQIDFLILHPKLGLLVLEVKGGKDIYYEGAQKQWYSITHFGDNESIKDPYLQGRQQTHDIIKYLDNLPINGFFASQMPFGNGVIFPSANPHFGNMPPHAERWMTITADDLEKIDKNIIAIMKRWGNGKTYGGTTNKVLKQLIQKSLIPVFKLTYAIGDHIKHQDKVLWKMTEQQCRYIDFIEQHKRVLIRGYAGTGKTVLAQEKARRAALNGRKVLLLCYNRPLKEYLSDSLSDFEGDITVENFHSLCRKYIIESGQEFSPPDKNQSIFWEEEVPLMMLQALEITLERFDTVIVDEAQDFSNEWWTVVEELMYSKDTCELYIFCDPEQDIYRRTGFFPVSNAPFMLTENCRNTKKITKLICKISGMEIKNPVNHPDGLPVVFKNHDTLAEELNVLESLINNLTGVEKIPVQNIIILSYYKRNSTCISNVDKLGKFAIVENPHVIVKNQVRFSTIGMFKGLEADVVILIDVNEHIADDKLILYIATSRAKHLLYILSKGVISKRYE